MITFPSTRWPPWHRLVKLTFGLQGLPPNRTAVEQLLAFERTIKEEPAALRAMADAGLDRPNRGARKQR